MVSIADLVPDGDAPLEELALAILSLRELESWRGFDHRRRRQEWLAGRAVAKALVVGHLAGELPWREVEIIPEPAGAPRVVLPVGSSHLVPWISISHSMGRAGAMLAPALPIGLDLESIRPRSERFVARVFSPRERDLVERCPGGRQSGLTALWTLKEATAKALGRGLPELVPWSIEVSEIDERGSARLGVKGEAANQLLEALGGELIGATAVTNGYALGEVAVRRRRLSDVLPELEGSRMMRARSNGGRSEIDGEAEDEHRGDVQEDR